MPNTRYLFALIASAALLPLPGCAPASVAGGAANVTPVAPDSFTVAMATTEGAVTMIFRRHWSPNGVDRLHVLLRARYYDGARFYRVVKDFVVQWGLAADPKNTAKYKESAIQDDSVRTSNRRGTISFARSGRNTRTTQLFINLVDNDRLDRDSGFGFPPVGEVVTGMEQVDRFYAEYPSRQVSQDSIAGQGDVYLRRHFPNLDAITSMKIIKEWR